ncbi:TPA: bifunctional diaminohydroxyphosphoribosylaminopyrimidine deaminase/5-amino-6-(5-phosphoribosylamino)uracil reductase RibD [Legionella pneumophila]|uniref:Riboflavin biosynthesis protein RibD n=1 Tax=Legionella pneumophila TaxID=446 RepID=A0AAN5KRD4_LEGPN|nr:bifunctional diaminohydroxyphosphoribosylaminopyrimidine deaminase/5-amino-6-(5-phosphoribosylamino)uracil reductase RibD [Legionella pneumophila]HAT1972024.1 bifunctional diaminohydroxyphosphoribosylaminopyrimidine deaminase/5-amino-6-(5-phosphoribosylamino)uracil reductase RibD [Legionella pneumophila]HAT6957311.1 bifunctional diaminohydroxyphosphoribosylaminopyrimidine deaminase/5-amino-6-(5-phosphoribosylamino)uracil reductase RibD [Legionella pneumophila]HEN4771409.1 bifunctional diamino
MHEQFLLAALEQAKLGRGFCAPNPSVGAVAVQNGNIIAQAWHRGAGTPHAEQLLLSQIPPQTPGVKLYVTLEPCNHWGKTPPCVDAIISHGIEEVIFSYFDPNPIVAKSNSSAKLREHGIQVRHIPITVIDEFYKSYAYWTVTHKPRVTVKIAQTFDGKIGRSEGERLILSNVLCEKFTHQMRAASDVILTSAKTVQMDNPRMSARLDSGVVAKPVAIIDRNLSLSDDAIIFSTAKHCHIYHQAQANQAKTYPNSTHYVMPLQNRLMDLDAIIAHLGQLGYHDVWVEAGGAIFSALHSKGLVHRTYLYLVPGSLGHQAISAYQQQDIFEKAHTVSWQAMGDNMIACLDWQEDECLPD